jgi:predicted O-linked N-acetylglucosamine transferase (SPINDLY family)
VYPHTPYGDYLRSINRCDMFLNPFPFGNTNGIVDTVRQGLPGVCLSGAEVHAHIDQGLFERLGLPGWLVARDVEEYVAAARRLVEDPALRVQLSQALLRTDPDRVLFEGAPEKFCEAIVRLHAGHRDAAAGGRPAPPLSTGVPRLVVQ